MNSLFGWSVALFAIVWVGLALRGIAKQHRRGERLNWIVWVAGLLVVLGAAGFFGSALLAIGMIKLPPSVEWPAGYVSGVVRSSSGLNIVPLEPSGRIQLYSPTWQYMTGWQVAAEGGRFKVAATRPSYIDVFTGRGTHHYVYSDRGKLLESGSYNEDYDSLPGGGRSMVVPTFPLLWPFTSPFLSMGLVILGFLGLRLSKRLRQA